MRAFLEAVALVLIAGVIFIGAPVAGALVGSLLGIVGTVLITYVVIKMLREENHDGAGTNQETNTEHSDSAPSTSESEGGHGSVVRYPGPGSVWGASKKSGRE